MNTADVMIRRRTVRPLRSPRAERSRRGRIARIVLGASLLGAVRLFAQAPSTDVWIATFDVRDGRVTIGDLQNVSNRPGYDNQPMFSKDGKRLYYTSGTAGAPTDLYVYDVRKRTTTRVTDSPESEYSPTPMPGGSTLSTVVVERDSTQRLWSVPDQPNGGPRTVILEKVKPVGYHAWLDKHTLALYLLGQPSVLGIADVRTGKVDTVATGVGRGVSKPPFARVAAFTQRDPQDSTRVIIRTVDPATRTITDVARGLPGAQDFAWSPGGRIFMAQGTSLFQKPRDGDWQRVIDFADPRIGPITRIAIAPTGNWIAFVAAEPGARPLASVPSTAPSTTAGREGSVATQTPPDGVRPAPANQTSPMPNPVSPPPRPSAAPEELVMTAPAQTMTVVVVRHGEKAAGTGDVALSEAGQARARALLATLENARVTAIFSSPLQRTRQTVAPLAATTGVQVVTIPLEGGVTAHAAKVAEAVLASGKGGTVVVSGHSNTVPAIVAALGGPAMPDLCDSAYDRLFVLTIPANGPRTLVRATYGVPTPDGDACRKM